MGNTQSCNSHTQSGIFCSTNIRRGEEASGESYEEKSVSYNVGDRTATVSIKNITARTGYFIPEKYVISITDTEKGNPLAWRAWPYRFEMMVEREYGHKLLKVSNAKHWLVKSNDMFWMKLPLSNRVGLKPPPVELYNEDATKNTKITNTREGAVIETSINPYRVRGYDKQRGLVVIEWKKRGWDQNPYMVTVSHYFASLHNTNTGFSVTATITGEHGLRVEEPVPHPATSLFEMFDQVSRTGLWTPNACPHCANKNRDIAHPN